MTKTAAISPAAARQQRYRDRRRSGSKPVRLEISPEIMAALIHDGRLAAADSGDFGALSDAVLTLLDAWARGEQVDKAPLERYAVTGLKLAGT